MSLSDRKIQTLKPQEKRYIEWDGRGLGLRVSKAGRKTWIMVYQYKNRSRQLDLGIYPAVSLAQAREAHAKAKLELAQGIDPGMQRRLLQQSVNDKLTVSELIQAFSERYAQENRKGWERQYQSLKLHVIPPLGELAAQDVTRRDVVLVLEKVAKTAPVIANRNKSLLVTIWNWAVDKGLILHNPLQNLRPLAKEKPRDRVLSDDEIAHFWAKVPELKMLWQLRQALRLTLVTGQRSGEVCTMEWQDIDWRDAVWRIPATKTKARILHAVPLTPIAIQLLNELKNMQGPSSWVFLSPYLDNGQRAPIQQTALGRGLWRARDTLGFLEPLKPHDLRRTVRTQLGKLGVRPDIAERILGHAVGRIIKTYDTYEYLDEKRAALEKWDKRLEKIISQTNEST